LWHGGGMRARWRDVAGRSCGAAPGWRALKTNSLFCQVDLTRFVFLHIVISLPKITSMGKKTGRPPKAIKQEKFIGYFVTHAQHFIILQKAEEAQVNISDYMRQMAIYGYVKPRWSEEEREWFKKLVGMSNDLHRLVEIAQKEGSLTAMLHFVAYRDLIDAAIKQLTHDL
jgi:hypothetical protein